MSERIKSAVAPARVQLRAAAAVGHSLLRGGEGRSVDRADDADRYSPGEHFGAAFPQQFSVR